MQEHSGFTGARHTVEQTDHRFCRIAFAQNVICHIHLLCRKRLRQPDVCHFLFWASEALDFKNLRCALIGKRADDARTHAGIVAQLAHGYGADGAQRIERALLLRSQLAGKIRHGTDHARSGIRRIAGRRVFAYDRAVFEQRKQIAAFFFYAEPFGEFCSGKSVFCRRQRHDNLPRGIRERFAVIVFERGIHAIAVYELIADAGGNHDLYGIVQCAEAAAFHPWDERQHFVIQKRLFVQNRRDGFQLLPCAAFIRRREHHGNARAVACAERHSNAYTRTYRRFQCLRHTIRKRLIKPICGILQGQLRQQSKNSLYGKLAVNLVRLDDLILLIDEVLHGQINRLFNDDFIVVFRFLCNFSCALCNGDNNGIIALVRGFNDVTGRFKHGSGSFLLYLFHGKHAASPRLKWLLYQARPVRPCR